MKYVLRLKGHKTGWVFADGAVETFMRPKGVSLFIDVSKFKNADEFDSIEEAQAHLDGFETCSDRFDIVEQPIAGQEYYGRD